MSCKVGEAGDRQSKLAIAPTIINNKLKNQEAIIQQKNTKKAGKYN